MQQYASIEVLGSQGYTMTLNFLTDNRIKLFLRKKVPKIDLKMMSVRSH